MKNFSSISVFTLFSFAFLLASCSKHSNAPASVTIFSVGDTSNFEGTAIWIYGTHNGNTALSFALGASYSLQGQQVFPLQYMNIQFQTDGAGYINGIYSPSDTVNLKENAIYSLP
jgi:hypothetical protein